jgi:hypothetical protein
MGKEVIRRHEIDIVDLIAASHFLDLLGQFVQFYGRPEALMRDLVVLAVDTFQRTPGKKDGA